MKKIISYHYIYLTTNKLNGHNYVGQKTLYKGETPETDGYLGSGKILIEYAIPKYGRENFEKKVLETCQTREEADILEKKWIEYYRSIGKAEYNVSDGGNGGYLGEKVNKKISNSLREIYDSEKGDIIKQKIRNARAKQPPMSEESKTKQKKSITEYWNSEQGQLQRKINSERNKSLAQTKGYHWYNNGIIQTVAKERPEGFVPGQLFTRPCSEESKQKKRDWYANLSEEEKAAHNKKAADARRGKPKSDTCKANISKANKGRRYYNNGEIEVMRFECPEGFVPGRCPKAKAAISKGNKTRTF